jgi:hypothetical protein
VIIISVFILICVKISDCNEEYNCRRDIKIDLEIQNKRKKEINVSIGKQRVRDGKIKTDN